MMMPCIEVRTPHFPFETSQFKSKAKFTTFFPCKLCHQYFTSNNISFNSQFSCSLLQCLAADLVPAKLEHR